MATYTKVYNNPYPDGWKDGKDGNTPVTASILSNQTETLESLEQYLEDNPITQGGGSGTTDYNDLTNKPSINGTELSGDITLDIPEKTSDLENDSGFLKNIKGQPYSDLSGKPTINGVEVVGDLTSEDLNLSGGGTTDYEALDNLPSVEGVELKGNITLAELSTKKQIRISWADYQTLSTEEKNDFSVVYYVYDYPENVIMASNVVFDNAEIGIEATEVQSALVELKNAIDAIASVRNLKTYTYFEQLGMSADNTLTEIYNAMPTGSNSQVLVPAGKSLSGTLPNTQASLLTIKKGNDERGVAIRTELSSGATQINAYFGEWKGWKIVTLT